MIKISLIHPSRGRPQMAFDNSRQWYQRRGHNVEYILSIDEDDPALDSYKALYNTDGLSNFGIDPKVIINKNRSAVDAINNAAKVATGDIFIVVSDDWELPENWGRLIIEAAWAKNDWIMYAPDGIQKWIITLPILDRHYYERFGYIYYPEYRHMFADTDLTCVADLTGRKIEATIPFKHLHYSVSKRQPDETSRRADKTWDQGERLFIERYKRNFDLKETPGKITDQTYINWIRSKLV